MKLTKAFENRDCTGEMWNVQPLDLAALCARAVCEAIFVFSHS